MRGRKLTASAPIYRVYRKAARIVRYRRLVSAERPGGLLSSAPSERWLIEYVSDGLANRQRFRCLNIVDDFTNACLAIEVDTSSPGRRTVRVLQQQTETLGLPKSVTLNNGLGFTGKVSDEYLSEHGFIYMSYAKGNIEAWQLEYNGQRPHSALGHPTPSQFARSFLTADSTHVSD